MTDLPPDRTVIDNEGYGTIERWFRVSPNTKGKGFGFDPGTYWQLTGPVTPEEFAIGYAAQTLRQVRRRSWWQRLIRWVLG